MKNRAILLVSMLAVLVAAFSILLTRTRFLELGPGDSLDIAALEVRRPYGRLNYAGFRRRLRGKMRRYESLVSAYDDFGPRRGFDPAALYNMWHANSEALPFVTTTIGHPGLT